MNQLTQKPFMRVFNGNQKLDKTQLRALFLKQLNNIYAVKTYLVKQLPGIADKATFPDLKNAILSGLDQIQLQILRMQVIYKIFDTKPDTNSQTGVKTLSPDDFFAGNHDDQLPAEKDIDILVYLQIAESIEISYFATLKNIAHALKHPEVSTLIEHNFDSAVDSKKLFELIAKEYIE